MTDKYGRKIVLTLCVVGVLLDAIWEIAVGEYRVDGAMSER